MSFISKRVYRNFFIAAVSFCNTLPVFATSDPVVTLPLLGSQQQVQVNKQSYVRDNKYFSLTPTQKTGTTTKVINNLVGVGIEESNTFYMPTSFSVTVNLEITTYDQAEAVISVTTKPFTVNFDKTDNSKYRSLSYQAFTGAYAVKVKVLSIDSGSVTWPVSRVLKIENQLSAERDYPFNCTQALMGLGAVLDAGNNELFTQWHVDPAVPNPGITEYDLEWSWVDESAVNAYKNGNAFVQDRIFKDNATRVTVSTISYNIPLLYDDEGKLFVRVRPVQIRTDGQRIEGLWTWIKNNATQPIEWETPEFYAFAGGHEPSLNWQASTSFAEEGKLKSVVQYFDGSLRNRQTVTKDNSTNKTIVAESFYDYQGRPVIQVLPAPTLNTAIAFARNFNQAINQPVNINEYPKWVYDKLDLGANICSSPATPFNTNFGTAKYYSPNILVDKPDENKYIPDASNGSSGYAYTETRLAADGRIASQGGVGKTFQIGSNHETKYYYEVPAQQELDALFGTDAGIASHYSKNIVRDANGQYSVSYNDMHNRVVATALAGTSPANMDALPTFNTATYTRQLIDNETNRISGDTIISSKPLVVMKSNTLYQFKYELNAKELSLLSCAGTPVCYDCLYTLNVTVTSDCDGAVVYSKEVKNFTLGQYSSTCDAGGNAAQGFNITLPESPSPGLSLAEGSYIVTKKLTLSSEARDAYRNVFLANDTCKKFIDFYTQELQALNDNSNCELTCTNCKAAIGVDFAAFKSKFLQQTGMVEPLDELTLRQLNASYDEAYANCDRLCNNTDGMELIRSIKQVMLQDMTPPYGQYAQPQNFARNYNIFKVPDISNIFEPLFRNISLPDYKNPITYKPDVVSTQGNYKDETGTSELSGAALNALNVDDFVDRFRTPWAEQLLPHHPEFKKLKLTEEGLKTTYQFEASIKKDEKWADAVSHGFIENIVNLDPFFSGPGAAYKTMMTNGDFTDANHIIRGITKFTTLQNGSACVPHIVTTTSVSMWRIALSTVLGLKKLDPADKCSIDYSNTETKVGYMMTVLPAQPLNGFNLGCETDKDLAWRTFRNLYIAERNKLISRYLNVNAAVFPAPFPNEGDGTKPYKLRFIDYDNPSSSMLGTEINDAGGVRDILATLSTDLNAGTAMAQAYIQAQYDSACSGYAQTWISQLQECPAIGTLSEADIMWLVSRLKAVCKAGADETHISGSSSIKPGAQPVIINGVSYSDFPEVIREYLRTKLTPAINAPYPAECSPWLITIPAPYDKQAVLTPAPVISKPTDCECERLTAVKKEFVIAGGSGTLSAFIATKYKVTISQGMLDTLTMLCNNTYSCNFLPAPVMLPPLLQCNGNVPAVKTCIECDEMRSIRNDFVLQFGTNAPVRNPLTENDAAINNAFEKYAAYRTGFTKSYTEYLAFLDTCKVGTTCDTLNTLITDFKNYYFNDQNGMAYRNLKLNPVVDEMVLGYNGLLERRRQSTFGTPLSVRYRNQPLNYVSNNRFYSISHTYYSFADSLFNMPIPIQVDYIGINDNSIVNYIPLFKANQQVSPLDFWHTPTSSELGKKYYGYTLMEEWGRFRFMYGELLHWEELKHELTPISSYYGVNTPHKKYLMPDPPGYKGSMSIAGFATAFVKIPAGNQTFNEYNTLYTNIYNAIYGVEDLLPTDALRDSLKHSSRIYQNVDIRRVLGFSLDKPMYDKYLLAGVPQDHRYLGLFVRAKLELMDGTITDSYFFNNTNFRLKDVIDSNLYNPNCQLAFTYFFNQQTGKNYTYAQIDSFYFAKCGIHPTACTKPVDCAPLNKVVNDYYSQYVQPAIGYADLDIRTFAGNKTPDAGPKGVFDINKNLIGNTVATGTDLQIKQSFATVWNTSVVNQAIGVLSSLPDGKMRLTLNPGKQVPADGIIGMRYYQFDAPVDTLDAALVGEGCYIDFGDNKKERIYNGLHARGTEVYDANFSNSQSSYLEAVRDTNIFHMYVVHIYPNSTVKTVTVYHPDVRGAFGFNNAYYAVPADISKLRKLRGYMPQETFRFQFGSTQDSTLNQVDSIKNFNQVTTISDVILANGNGLLAESATELRSTRFASFANNSNLKHITFDQGNFPTYQHKNFNDLFPNLPVNFKQLTSIEMQHYMGEYTNTVNFSTPNLKLLYFIGGSLTQKQIDTIIIQVSRTSRDSGALYLMHDNSAARSTASNSAVAVLTAKKFELDGGGLFNSVAGHTVVRPMRDTIPVTNTFTDFYNEQNGTSYDYLSLKAYLLSKYGFTLNPASIPPKVCTVTISPTLCGLNNPASETVPIVQTPCADFPSIAFHTAYDKYQLYIDSIRNVFDTAYYNKCMGAKNLESFTVTYQTSEYHYTLYYYDQAGNLVKTVPPEGVDRDATPDFLNRVKTARSTSGSAAVIPFHRLETQYRYNTLNQVVMQNTPDGGKTEFWYDRLGRLVVSQNAKQAATNRFSYTEYDRLGRIVQVGQKPQAANSMNRFVSRDTTALFNWLNGTQNKEQITRTAYDFRYFAGEEPGTLVDNIAQKNLRNRVSYTQVFDTEPVGSDNTRWAGVHNAATYYSYDIHGNVEELLQDFASSLYHSNAMNSTGNRWKKTVYNYDLISGKVNEVAYQPGMKDAFYHRYSYDAENRITEVETSTDRFVWEKDARYSYYRHGPLARAIIGQNQVQGIDYAYTLQGWLKGVNSSNLSPAYNKQGLGDIGRDGAPMGVVNQLAKDAFGFGLSYYQGSAGVTDYKPIFTGTDFLPFADPSPVSSYVSLYNGNVAAMAVNLPKVGVPMLYTYKYDQLNRITGMQANKNFSAVTNTWTNSPTTTDYKETISYDANGNILTYLRNGAAAVQGTDMDNLTYQYPRFDNSISNQNLHRAGKIINNRLRYVRDAVAGTYTEDIKTQTTLTASQVTSDLNTEQAGDNYAYDQIGNLIKDTKENISSITWSVYGKILSIVKPTGTIYYTYDASGNRISKTIGSKTTWYVRDASGNVMSVYAVDPAVNTGKITQSEINLYGSSRLGVWNLVRDMSTATIPEITNFSRGNKYYELTNHLGNVLATITDKKIQVDDGVYNLTTGQQTSTTPNGLVDYYLAEVASANDYYPFGMMMPGRKFNAGSGYRYGFNGKEKDNEDYGEGNAYDFGERIYDSRLGRWLSLDPLMEKYPNESPYLFTGGNPIFFKDPDGRDRIITIISLNKDGSTTTLRRIDKRYFNIYTVKGKFSTAYQDRTHKESIAITYTIDNRQDVPIVSYSAKAYDINDNYTLVQQAEDNIKDFFTDKPRKYGLTMSGGGDGVSPQAQLEWDSNLPKAEQSDYIGSITSLLDAAAAYGDLAGIKPGASDIIEDFSKDKSLLTQLKKIESILNAAKTGVSASESPVSNELNAKPSLKQKAEKVKITLKDTTMTMYTQPPGSIAVAKGGANAQSESKKAWSKYKQKNPSSKEKMKTYNQTIKIPITQ